MVFAGFILILLAFFLLTAILVQYCRIKPEKKVPRPAYEDEFAKELVTTGSEAEPAGYFPAELPRSYGDNKICLLVRDPNWLFAYWELNEEALKDAYRLTGTVNYDDITLRVVEFSNKMSYFDIAVRSPVGDWCIHVGKPATTFYCLLGLKIQNIFTPLVVSNVVTTPRNGMSTEYDDEWMLVTDREQRMLKRIGQLPIDLSSPFLFRK